MTRISELKLKIIFFLIFSLGILGLPKGSEADTHTAATCTAADVNSAISAASNGDTVAVPAGVCTWETNNSVTVNKEIILQGGVAGNTVITCAGGDFTPVMNVIAPNVTITGFEFTNAGNSNQVYPVNFAATAFNFRVTNNKSSGNLANAYHIVRSYGVIDNNVFAHTTNAEVIQVQGPCDAWQQDAVYGTNDGVFIENNLFTEQGYMTCNAASQCIFRYNTITGGFKYDAHGVASSTNDGCPSGINHDRSARSSEVYNNLWDRTGKGGYFSWINIRGGTGRAFNNDIISTVNQDIWAGTDEYCAMWTNAANCIAKNNPPDPGCCCTWPCFDQPGMGKDPSPYAKVGAAEPFHFWNNRRSIDGGLTWYQLTPAEAPSQFPHFGQNQVVNCAVAGQCGTSFLATDIVKLNRDYYVYGVTRPSVMDSYATNLHVCPHPLTGLTGTCGPAVAGRCGYNISSNDTTPPAAPRRLVVN